VTVVSLFAGPGGACQGIFDATFAKCKLEKFLDSFSKRSASKDGQQFYVR